MVLENLRKWRKEKEMQRQAEARANAKTMIQLALGRAEESQSALMERRAHMWSQVLEAVRKGDRTHAKRSARKCVALDQQIHMYEIVVDVLDTALVAVDTADWQTELESILSTVKGVVDLSLGQKMAVPNKNLLSTLNSLKAWLKDISRGHKEMSRIVSSDATEADIEALLAKAEAELETPVPVPEEAKLQEEA